MKKLLAYFRRHQKPLFWATYGVLALALIFTSKMIMFVALILALILTGIGVNDYEDYD